MNKVATFSKISDADVEKRKHTAFGDSIDSMEVAYHKFKQSRKSK